jgi:methionyl-tRNA synthetase
MTGTFYVTTPIYYVNAAPHIGHAYTSIAADALARWHRLLGDDVRFLTGTDEHGKKIEEAAKAAGLTPLEHADRYSAQFRELWEVLDIRYDDFIRTTEPRHQKVVQALWQRMKAAGDIYLGKYEGWYSVGDEAYFTEDELVEGRSPTGHEVSWVVEPSYFFRLSKYGPRLLEHLRAHPDMIRPESRYNEIVRFLERGLQDISVSRTTFKWGIPVPDDPGHVIYVWVDALTNYVSALGGPGAPLYEKFWPHVHHLIGKDIIRFHAVYWPAFLMSAGLPVPKTMFAHGWWTHAGRKMSKTFGNVVDPGETARKFGADAFRYFLLREVTFGLDGDFSETALRDRINGDLANDYGNLLNRSLGMLQKYRGGTVTLPGQRNELDEALVATFRAARSALLAAMDEMQFHRALAAVWELVRAGNKYVDAAAPWTLAKQGDAARLDAVLYNLCETLRIVGIWTLPFLPSKAADLLDRLGVPDEARDMASTAEWGKLSPGGATRVGDPLFPRLDAPPKAETPEPKPEPKKTMETKPSEAPAKPAEGVATIEYADFQKLDLRVARIVAAERHPDADRLLKLTVDAGEGRHRTVCAGIASAYKPGELVGRTVVLLANLAPRKLRGVMSEGMLLAAGEGTAIHLLDVPGGPAPGTKIS